MYKLIISNRNYETWNFVDVSTFEIIQDNIDIIHISPLDFKLFSNDMFSLDQGKIKLEHSSIRTGGTIPGILTLIKTYGRHKNGKSLYKCIPDDVRIPAFLVPYEVKHLGFCKVQKNIYVTFYFFEWTEKHPLGLLDQVIGPVDNLVHFYEYQLYCKSLHNSIQFFQNETTKSLKKKNEFIENIGNTYPTIQDRTSWSVFSIDPHGSLDFDDAFSIHKEKNGFMISIYIANVALCMEELGLWSSFSKRVSTIYLPDKKRPMLPTILSDCLCSLQQGVTRLAFVMDVFLSQEVGGGITIEKIEYHNCKVSLKNNYRYEEPLLFLNPDYQLMNQLTSQLITTSKKYAYLRSVTDSHDLVCYWMVFMNYQCALDLLQNKNGVFRSTILKDVKVSPSSPSIFPDHVPESVTKHLKQWMSTAGQYVDGSEVSSSFQHHTLELDAYVHITSPIRRLVDLMNLIVFQQNKKLIVFSQDANDFYVKWIHDLDYINTSMRAIRRVQCDCNLLELCTNHPDTLEKEYDGYVFDKIERTDMLFQYMVYLPVLKVTAKVTERQKMENYEKKQFKLYIFQDEERLKKKIRLMML